ncbi:MAG: 2-oxoacid:acceptor oxidoreductase family protein [candidate division Zixibacteria bacterium]|jgi:2-oxoglutarate ferredoxin oxidoreductase subunit gamma|nr:2-oxoacid:acceptor oxidoreductase family protein [candidate division Zixibacteria bacterium]
MGSLLEKISVPQDRFEIRLSGSGGQGMILGAVILSEAIGADGTKNVSQTQSYGPEARGGASKSDVVVSKNQIFYPKAMKLDLLLAMTQESMDSYYKDLKEGGTLVIDNVLVTDVPTDHYYGLPFTRLAREEAGHVMVANVIALGAIAELTGVVDKEKLLKAVLARAPRGTEDKNRKAVEIGFREAAKLKKT